MATRVAILGSTGSIGTQALEVIAAHPQRFEVAGLAAGKNVALLQEQAAAFSPRVIASAADGEDGLHAVALESGAQIVLVATDGFVAFSAAFAAAARGIDLAVANKELIVGAGALLMSAAARSGSRILPVDSEHSAIFQCLIGEDPNSVDQLVLTASGGPFWRRSAADLETVTVAQALAHPTWQMGVKNTIDSATMMNKGLEMIEASHLFGIPPERIAILVHPQSIAHGAVIFKDGSVKAQLAAPDMRLPIGYALAYPQRLDNGRSPDALAAFGSHPEAAALRYDFERPDGRRFPCVELAYEAAQRGGAAPVMLSAANEIAARAFVDGEIGFTRIPMVIEAVLRSALPSAHTVEALREADQLARRKARETIDSLRIRLEV